jgi:hypothetical protein
MWKFRIFRRRFVTVIEENGDWLILLFAAAVAVLISYSIAARAPQYDQWERAGRPPVADALDGR